MQYQSSQFRGVSLLLMLLPLATVLLLSTTAAPCFASPIPSEVAEVLAVEVELEGEEMATEVSRATDAASTDDEDQEEEEDDVGEELTPGAQVSGDLTKNAEDDEESSAEAKAASYYVPRIALDPQLLRMMNAEQQEVDAEEEMGQSRVGELGAIISVIKIATELGEAVLPVVIKEVEASPIGNLVIGVIGGVNDGASGNVAGADLIHAGLPLPVTVARRAVSGFMRSRGFK